jgi:high-affinity iron transporter
MTGAGDEALRPLPPAAGPLLALLLVTSAALVPATAGAASDDVDARRRAALEDVRATVEAAVDRYVAAYGNWTAASNASAEEAARDEMAAAGRTVGAAFLKFEQGHGNESSLNAFMQGSMSSSFYRGFERDVVLLRSLMVSAEDGEPAPASEVQARGQAVDQALDRVETCLPDGCEGTLVGTAAQAFLVLLREGFEAILVLGAAVAYLRKSNRADKIPLVYGGVAAGVLASVGVWLLLQWVLGAAASTSASARVMVEGASMLLAAAVLLYVSYWMFDKAEAREWQAYLEGEVDDRLASDRAWLLGLVGFLAVFREGVETALFLQALTRQGGATGDILLGIGAAVVALAVLYYLVHGVGVRVPLRRFFVATSAVLFALALRFTGLGVFEFQEANLLPVTPLPGVVSWFEANPLAGTVARDVLGATATVEVLVAEGLLVLALVAGAGWSWTRNRRPEAAGG